MGSDRILLSDGNEGLYIVTEECICDIAATPVPEMIGAAVSIKNRMLSFEAGEAGRTTAIRVTFVDLPEPYNDWNGDTLWAGAPAEVSQNGASVDPLPGFGTFLASQLQCAAPVFNDWSQFGTIHLFHEGIVPGGSYLIQAIDSGCSVTSEVSYSAPLNINTSIYGDTIEDCASLPCSPPEGTVNINDVFALVEAFGSVSGAIGKHRADLDPRCLDLLLNITDIFSGVLGFSGLPYSGSRSADDACSSVCVSPFP